LGRGEVKGSSAQAGQLLLLDTHVLVWTVEGSPKLGQRAKVAINRAARQGRVAVSAISLWEIAMLVGKGRLKLKADVLEWIREALGSPGVQLIHLEPEIAVASTRLPWEMHAHPADRILIATARHLGATLVTADAALLAHAAQGHFAGLNAGV
jgi:PIN domain nuclease of toxin-antitoxin system